MRMPWTALIVWALAGPMTGAAAQSRNPIRVVVDVKPGDTPTTIETDRGGMIPVALLSTAQFDAADVDAQTIRLGPEGTEAEPFRSMREDVDRDGRKDLLILVPLKNMRVSCSVTEIRLTGMTVSGRAIEGSEKVAVEGCPPPR